MDQSLADKLEALVDAHGLFNVLEELQTVCYAKAEHFAVNWQDIGGKQAWNRAGNMLNKPLEHKFIRAL